MTRICEIPGCGRSWNARGYCTWHGQLWRQGHGPVWLHGPKKPSTDDRFDTMFLVAPNGCHLWQSRFEPWGHGQFEYGTRADRRRTTAHKYAYERKYGPVPPGMVLDHFVCDTPNCVNPDHVRPVTHRENSLRGDSIASRNAAKVECIHGHVFDEANTRIKRDGSRDCRACARERKAVA